MKVSRAVGIAIGSLALVAVAWFVYFWAWPTYALLSAPVPEDRCPGHERFDQIVWQDSVRVYSALAPRGCMVDDLLARIQLKGMDKGSIIRLLGVPQPTEYFSDYDFVYWLGPERGLFSIDSEWLVLRLDSTGVVTEARLVTD